MFEKLKAVKERYAEITDALQNPDILSDPVAYKKFGKERKNLIPVIEKFNAYNEAEELLQEAQNILSELSDDRDLKEMAQMQFNQAKSDLEKFREELKILLLPRDPNDEKNVIIEIRGGAGGEEATLFAASLFRMYSMYAERKGWKLETLGANIRELGGLKEIGFLVTGDGAYSRLKFESGVHRVQRVPETEASGRIHTSTVTVAVLPEAEEVDVEINPAELQIDTFRASGAGGQHINKTESAIRITHIPTGLVVECQDERSQHKNKDKAMKILRAKLYEKKCGEQNERIANQRKTQVGTGDRSERIRTYNFPQSRVTDHRIGLTLYKLDAILNGDIDEIIDQLTAFDQAEKLKQGVSD
ncbi:MAG: peptide chain release factor 1 [Oscillospiraceae bacterium]|jgi:peptide chain release factor 1|nr:peptide chain release factor 1 [Oscillospiraceae bacterium]